MSDAGCGCGSTGADPALARGQTPAAARSSQLEAASPRRCGNGTMAFPTSIPGDSPRERILTPAPEGADCPCGCRGSCGCASASPGPAGTGWLVADDGGRWPAPGVLSARRTPGVLESHQDRSEGSHLMDEIVAARRRERGEPRVELPDRSGRARNAASRPVGPARTLSRSTILWPGPLGEVRQDIRSTPALLDAIQAAVRRRKAGVLEDWVFEPMTPENGWLTPDPADPHHIPGPRSHEDSLLPGAGSPAFDITYRSESYHFDSGYWLDLWVAEYLGYTTGWNLVSSPVTVMAKLWSSFIDQFDTVDGTTKAFTNVTNSLGCYALPTTTMATEMGCLFFTTGYGAPYVAWVVSAALVYAYADEATDKTTSADCDGLSCCDGYTTFLRTVVAGGTATVSKHSTSWPTTSCMNFHFIGADEGPPSASDCSGSLSKTNCNSYSGTNGGQDCTPVAWNDWFVDAAPGSFADLMAGGVYIYDPKSYTPDPKKTCGSDAGGPNGEGGATGPVTGCGSSWFGLNWHCWLGAAPLAFDGYVMDAVMFLANLVYDHVRATIRPFSHVTSSLPAGVMFVFNPDYVEAMGVARRLAAYALRIPARWGYHTVHEVAHTYTGDNHCTGWACCGELAAQHWLCRVEGLLGLPFCEYYTDPIDGSGDWDATENLGTAVNCKDLCVGCETGQPTFSCTFAAPGERNDAADVHFEVGSCADPTTETSWS